MNIIYQWWIHLNCGIMSHFDFILYRIWSFGPKPHAFLPPRNKRLNKRSVSVCTQAYVCFLEEGMAAHSCILACRIPWTEEPVILLSESRLLSDFIWFRVVLIMSLDKFPPGLVI